MKALHLASWSTTKIQFVIDRNADLLYNQLAQQKSQTAFLYVVQLTMKGNAR